MAALIEVFAIVGDWAGGHHGEYPKVLSVDPDSDRPFCISEGSGWGFGGGCFTLSELIEQNFIRIFDREESRELYDYLLAAYREKTPSKQVIQTLLCDYRMPADNDVMTSS